MIGQLRTVETGTLFYHPQGGFILFLHVDRERRIVIIDRTIDVYFCCDDELLVSGWTNHGWVEL